ncbi:MAG: tRNA (adenosine(37)-N6)-dimethylallyltransferase MiaA, partial [Actinomycetota bacterium]
MPAEPLLALVGPTASGKTEAGIAVAEALGAEIVSVDSTTIYRGMDVGSAKPTPEQRSRVGHHLVDVADPDESFTVARYQRLAREAIDDITGRGRRVLLVGGSGLYFRAIVDDLAFPPTDASTRALLEDEAAAVGADVLYRRLEELDPVAAGRIDPDN